MIDPTVQSLLITTAGGAIAALFAHIFAMRRESRDRAWHAEERKAEIAEIVERAKAQAEAVRIEAAAAAEAAALKVEISARKVASALREDQRKTADHLESKFDQRFEEVKTVTTEALHAANNLNEKIAHTGSVVEALNQRLLEQGRNVTEIVETHGEKVQDIHATVSTNTGKLDDIREKVTRLDERNGTGTDGA